MGHEEDDLKSAAVKDFSTLGHVTTSIVLPQAHVIIVRYHDESDLSFDET